MAGFDFILKNQIQPLIVYSLGAVTAPKPNPFKGYGLECCYSTHAVAF
jgi:hypothetical protein